LKISESNDKRKIIKNVKKVYDSQSEDEFQIETREYVLKPDNQYLILLDCLILISLIYSVFIIPIRIIFHGQTNITIVCLDIFIDICLLLDFLLSFFTGFYDFEENYNKMYLAIMINYIRNYFLIDVLSLIPFNSLNELSQLNSPRNMKEYPLFNKNISDMFDTNESSLFRLTRIIRLLKLLKVLTFNKFNIYLKNSSFLQGILIPFYLKACLYYFYFMVIFHVLSCLFIYLGTVMKPNWIQNANLINSSFTEIYLASIYFNHLTILTIGYGDIISKNSCERIYNILLIIFGVMLYSFALSWISNMFLQYNEKSKKYESKKDYLNQLTFKYEIKNLLYSKITVHLIHESKFFK